MSDHDVDLRASAYVFGELSIEAKAAFERDLEQSAALREEVLAIRETVAALESEFAGQATKLDAPRRRIVQQAIDQRTTRPPAVPLPVPVPPPVEAAWYSMRDRRPLALVVMAAGLVILAVLIYPSSRNREVAMNEVGPVTPGRDFEPSSTVLAESESAPAGAVGSDATIASTKEARDDVRKGVDQSETARQSGSQRDTTVIEYDAAAPAIGAIVQSDAEIRGVTPQRRGVVKESLTESQVALDFDRDRAELVGPPPTTKLDALSGEASRIELRESLATSVSPRGQTPSAGAASEVESKFGDGLPTDRAEAMMVLPQIEPGARKAGKAKPTPPPRRTRPRKAHAMDSVPSESELEEELDKEFAFLDNDDDLETRLTELDDMMGMKALWVEDADGDKYEPIEDNPFVKVGSSPQSTFSVDVDTASYAKVRLLLNQNAFPRPDAVRIEELLNYFDYGYAAPEADSPHPFAASMDVAACPWNPGHRLARIGIKAKVIEHQRPSSNLVFLLDVSGSMDEPNKLPLVVDGMKMLTDQLSENDKVSIVVYAGAAGLVLDSTTGDKKQQIVSALDRLKAGGSTNGGHGILLAYEIARDNFIRGGTNRVILCSDGDFNVGVTGPDHLVRIVQHNARSDIFLSVLGFGTGNHNDAMMEQISNKGNGNYSFIDSRSEAQKVLVEEMGGTLVTIAKDVKVQVEFNPKQVGSYRLIGYENRVLETEDFDDDAKDAGDIGAGHTVTALYEITPADTEIIPRSDPEPLRYQRQQQLTEKAESGELLVLKLRYKQPDGDASTLIEIPVSDTGKGFEQTDRDFKFAASVAAFGMLLRDSPYKGTATFTDVVGLASEGARGDDYGYRTEFVTLANKARILAGE